LIKDKEERIVPNYWWRENIDDKFEGMKMNILKR